jgi:hypothetical protein
MSRVSVSRTTFRRLLALPTAVTFVVAGLAGTSSSQASTPSDVVASNWLGFGFNENPQPPSGASTWSESDWDLLTQRVDYIKPGVVRVNFNLGWFWTGTDTTDNYDYTTDEMANALQVLQYYHDNGIPVISGIFGFGDLTYDDPHTAEVEANLVKYLQDQGLPPTYWASYNEPNSTPDDLSYSDWVTSETNLQDAFADLGVDTDETALVGPDTAEAGISKYDGDLGHQTAPSCTGSCPSSLVWHLDSLSTFTASVYAATDTDTAVSFQSSADGSTWTSVPTSPVTPVPTVTGKNAGGMWRYDYTPSSPITDANYLRLSVASSDVEHTAASVEIDGPGSPLIDPLDDLSLTESALDTGTWTSSNSWWLDATKRDDLITGAEAHFYDQELYGATPDYVEPVMTAAIGQLRAAQPGAPILLGETGMKAATDGDGNKTYDFALDTEQAVRMADLAVQEARAGVDGAAAWCLDGYSSKVYCGMWGRGTDDPSTPSAHSTALRPWFYTWSLLCRYLPTGSTIHAPAQPSDVRVLAAELPDGGWTFVLVNRGTSSQTVSVTEPTGSITVDKYVYNNGSTPLTDSNGFPVPTTTLTLNFTSGHNLTVGADSVAVFTTES